MITSTLAASAIAAAAVLASAVSAVIRLWLALAS